MKREGKEVPLKKWASSKEARLEMMNTTQQNVVASKVPDDFVGEYPGWHGDFGECAEYAGDDTLFILTHDGKILKVSPDRTKFEEIVQSDVLTPPWKNRLRYNPARDTILTGCDGEIREYDRNGKLVNSLSHSKGTGRARAWTGEDTFLVTHYGPHYVQEIDWNETELWSFGEYGNAGSDLTHLHHPRSAAYPKTDWYLIADAGNDRVLYVDGNGNVKQVRVFTNPISIDTYKPGPQIVMGTGGEGLRWLGVDLEGRLAMLKPFEYEHFGVHPTKPLIATYTAGGIHEFSLESMRLMNTIYPQEVRLMDEKTIDAGATATSRPQIVGPYTTISVYSKGTQDHDVHIEKLRTSERGRTLFELPKYDEFDVNSVAANELGHWSTQYSMQIMRIKVENTGGSSGDFSLWISGKR